MGIDSNNYVNEAAFCTILSASAGTVVSAMVAGGSTTALRTAGYAGLTLGCASVAGSAVTAWLDPSSRDVKNYFKNVKSHFGIGASTMATIVSQTLANAIVEGISQGLKRAVQDKVYHWLNPNAKKDNLVIS